MHLGPLLTPRDAGLLAPRQSGQCIDCPAPPPCLCASDEQCIQINRSCYNCFTFKCVKQNDSSSGGGKSGISGGAVAGAVIGILVFLAAVVVAFLWYRRRWGRRPKTAEVKPDVPASAADVLSRPDPAEKPASPAPPPTNNYQVYSNQSNTTIDLTNQSRGVTPPASVPNPFASHRSSVQSDPFQDNHSIQTTSTGTQGTNVIPIALVAPNSNPSLTQPAEPSSGVTTPPDRPVRSPELNLEHVNVSRDELRAPRYAPSAISGISGVSSRHSYLSGASFSSDFLNEDPVIVTGGTKGGVRQVLGVHQAQVLHAPSSPGTPLTPSLKSRPSVRSPLAASSFTPAEAPQETGREYDNRSINSQGPFSDKEASPSYSQTTFGTPSAQDQDHPPVYQAEEARTPIAENLQVPWRQNENRGSTRPSSMATQAGSMIAESIIDIGSATRVNVGQAISPPATGSSFPRSPYRTTMGRLVTPSAASLKSPDSASTGSSFEDQQRAALAHAQAQAQAQGLNRRVSGSTVASGVSLRADSILESFPFVPPSPISSRPVRSPPRSPLNQQFATVNSSSSEGRQSAAQPESATLPLEPPNRKFLGLSTASNSSTNSTGLGSFPFHVEEPPSTEARKPGAPPPPTSYPPAGFQRTRASLDTLALTSDLTSYPLGFDRRGHDAA